MINNPSTSKLLYFQSHTVDCEQPPHLLSLVAGLSPAKYEYTTTELGKAVLLPLDQNLRSVRGDSLLNRGFNKSVTDVVFDLVESLDSKVRDNPLGGFFDEGTSITDRYNEALDKLEILVEANDNGRAIRKAAGKVRTEAYYLYMDIASNILDLLREPRLVPKTSKANSDSLINSLKEIRVCIIRELHEVGITQTQLLEAEMLKFEKSVCKPGSELSYVEAPCTKDIRKISKVLVSTRDIKLDVKTVDQITSAYESPISPVFLKGIVFYLALFSFSVKRSLASSIDADTNLLGFKIGPYIDRLSAHRIVGRLEEGKYPGIGTMRWGCSAILIGPPVNSTFDKNMHALFSTAGHCHWDWVDYDNPVVNKKLDYPTYFNVFNSNYHLEIEDIAIGQLDKHDQIIFRLKQSYAYLEQNHIEYYPISTEDKGKKAFVPGFITSSDPDPQDFYLINTAISDKVSIQKYGFQWDESIRLQFNGTGDLGGYQVLVFYNYKMASIAL